MDNLYIKNLGRVFKKDSGWRGILLPWKWMSPRTWEMALHGICLQIRKGESVALLGPNGAGKTTLMKVICGLIYPSFGSIRTAGFDVTSQEVSVRKNVGYASNDDRSFFLRLSGRHNIEFFGTLYGLCPKTIEFRTDYLAEALGVWDKLSEPYKSYSTGMCRKLSLIRAVLHEPCMLCLDEITNGMDMDAQQRVFQLLKQDYISSMEKTLIWSTHRTEEIEKLGLSRVIVLNLGKVSFNGETTRWNSNSNPSTRV